ncbi:unnamed protein product [Brassica oleracea var. botrytis]|uniref:Uncharacterized protein n=1 Tax=Brassica oleracea TaxID=3712 RepID=A0A3P6E112_BRAOL|nr:unnamed protein product [Brassica oleracea]
MILLLSRQRYEELPPPTNHLRRRAKRQNQSRKEEISGSFIYK